MNSFDVWFESLRRMDDWSAIRSCQLIDFEESLARCSKQQSFETRLIPEGSRLRELMRKL